jgi:hypothetical protein
MGRVPPPPSLSWPRQLITIAAGTTFVAVALRVLHALLFRQMLDTPLLFAGWLVLGGLLGIVLRALTRGPATGGEPAERLDEWTKVALAAFTLLLLFLFHRAYFGVVSDARDYFVQARSIVFDRDFHFSEEELRMMAARGQALYYPPGTALLWAPFLAACHVYLGVLNLLGGEFVRDGYSEPYRMAVGLGTLTYGVAALVMIVRVLRSHFPARVAVLATLTLCCGTFVLWYLTIEAAMSHGVSMFAVTLFLSLWHRTRHARTARQWVAVSAAAGLMVLVRWQESLFAIILIPEAVQEYRRRWRNRSTTGLVGLLPLLAGPVAGIVVLLPQFWLWRRSATDAFTLPRGEFGLRWFEPAPMEVLFSPNHGLLTWTPLVYAALVGLVLFAWREPRVGGALIVGFLGQLYANSLLQVWWGGSGFGARRFVDCALIFAVGLAGLIEWCRSRPLAVVSAVLAAFVAVNVALMSAVRTGGLPSGEGLTAGQLLSPFYERLGNPFSFPATLLFTLRHGAPASQYDELGRRVYNNLQIDVGGPDDGVFLTYGWSAQERGRAFSFRWAVGGTSGLSVPLRERDDYTLRVRAEPFNNPRVPDPRLVVVMNGDEVATVSLERGLQEYVVEIARESMQRNLNRIEFRFSNAASPRSLGLSDDGRELTALFDSIELTRR